MSARVVGSVLLCFSLLAGCGEDREPPRTWLEDHFVSDGAEADGLHSPYAAGTRLMLSIETTSPLITPGRRLEVTSDDPGVVRIDVVEQRTVEAVAVAPGTTTLRVVDVATGDELASEEVEVRVPTRVEIYPHVAQTRYVADEQALLEDGTLHVLGGSSALYYLRYFDGETPLSGSDVLDPSVDATPAGEGDEAPAVEVLHAATPLEWLIVVAGDAGGSADVTLRVGERDLGVVRVESVPHHAVATIELQDDEADAQEGEEVAVLGRAFDESGNPVEGVRLGFELDGVAVEGEGDLFAYHFDPTSPRGLRASAVGTGITAVMTVHADPESGRVTSSIAPSCSVARGGRGGALVAGVVLVIGVVLAGRRRTA